MRTAAVVGGGIGGLAVAAGLARAGWSVRVLEREPEFREVGAGISLWANALSALDALGVGSAVRAAGAAPGRGGFRTSAGRWLKRTEGDLVMIHRADLLEILRTAVPGSALVPGTRVSGAATGPDRARVEAPGEGEAEYDLVVGADGLRSAVRTALWPGADPVYSGKTSWRLVAPTASLPPFEGSETWGPGAVFGAFPMGGGRAYCYASALAPAGGTGGLDELRARYADWPDPVPQVLAAADPAGVLRHDLHHLPPLDTYVRGRVALLGDAAHAMTPHLGQGGCQALEDAAVLAAALADPDTDRGLRAYDAARRPRTQALARRSFQVGRVGHLRNPVARAVRDLAVRLVPEAAARRQLQAVAGWRAPRP